MGLLLWTMFGLITGAAARYLLPGRDPGGLIVTTILGIAGAMVGGYVGTRLGFGGVNDIEFWSLLVAIGGAVIVLAGYRLITKILAT